MKPLFKNTLFMLAGAYLFGLLLLAILNFTGCKSDPAPRIIRTSNPGILKFQPKYDFLAWNIAVELDSTGKVINFTTEDDNRWPRTNGFMYSEQISWKNPYFTDLPLKYMVDYPIMYGCQIPMDTLAAHIVAGDSILIAQYIAYTPYGAMYTVEQFDWWIEEGELEYHAEKVKP